MGKPTKFSELFSEPQDWGEAGLVFSREMFPEREEAAAYLAGWLYALGHTEEPTPIDPKELSEDTVRFRFAGREECQNWDEWQENGRVAMWIFDAGRGSKPVWVWER